MSTIIKLPSGHATDYMIALVENHRSDVLQNGVCLCPCELTPSSYRLQLEPPAEVHRLQRHCRDLVDQRNEALAELAKVKVALMEVMEQQVERTEEADDSSVSRTDIIPEQEVVRSARPPPPAVRRQPTGQSHSRRLEHQVSGHPTTRQTSKASNRPPDRHLGRAPGHQTDT